MFILFALFVFFILFFTVAQSETVHEKPALNFNFGSNLFSKSSQSSKPQSQNQPAIRNREPISLRKPIEPQEENSTNNRLLNNAASRLKNLIGITTNPADSLPLTVGSNISVATTTSKIVAGNSTGR